MSTAIFQAPKTRREDASANSCLPVDREPGTYFRNNIVFYIRKLYLKDSLEFISSILSKISAGSNSATQIFKAKTQKICCLIQKFPKNH
jgi:hypothetical protein